MTGFDHLDAIESVLRSQIGSPEIKLILYEHLTQEQSIEVNAPISDNQTDGE